LPLATDLPDAAPPREERTLAPPAIEARCQGSVRPSLAGLRSRFGLPSESAAPSRQMVVRVGAGLSLGSGAPATMLQVTANANPARIRHDLRVPV